MPETANWLMTLFGKTNAAAACLAAACALAVLLMLVPPFRRKRSALLDAVFPGRRRRRMRQEAMLRARQIDRRVRLAVAAMKKRAAEADKALRTELEMIPWHVGQIYRLSEEHAFGDSLRELGISRENLERWRHDAEEFLVNAEGTPASRRDPRMVHAPVNTRNPNEPGTPGIAVNERSALPALLGLPAETLPCPPKLRSAGGAKEGLPDMSGGSSEPWRVESVRDVIITPPPMEYGDLELGKHPIEKMIEEALEDRPSVPETLLPERPKAVLIEAEPEERSAPIAA